jgi:hypothetical protein
MNFADTNGDIIFSDLMSIIIIRGVLTKKWPEGFEAEGFLRRQYFN